MRRSVAVWLLVTGCGRLGFEARGGADSGTVATDTNRPLDAAFQMPTLVQSVAISSGAPVGSIQFPIQAVGAGHLLIVATGSFGTGGPLTSIIDPVGNVYTSANAQASWASGPKDLVEIWYSANSVPGATTVQLNSTTLATRDAWFLEIAGMDRTSPLDVSGSSSDPPPSTSPAAPTVSPTTVPSFVISVGDFAGLPSGLDASSKFTALALKDGNDAAIYIPTTPGAWGAVWADPSLSSYCTSTAAFRPAAP